MGLDYSYLLNFKRGHLWDALQGVAAFSQLLGSDTRFYFPEGDRYLPLQIWTSYLYEYSQDDPLFTFTISFHFEEEDLIVDFVGELGNEDTYRAPPYPDGLKHYPIDFIYLDVCNDLTKLSREFTQRDLVLPMIPSQGHISQQVDYLTFYGTTIN